MKKLLVFLALAFLPFQAQAANLISTYLAGSATAVTNAATVAGYSWNGAGNITMLNGGAAGTVKVSQAVSTSGQVIFGPGDGLKFGTNLYIELDGVDSITVFYR